jgi:hypothetical protein
MSQVAGWLLRELGLERYEAAFRENFENGKKRGVDLVAWAAKRLYTRDPTSKLMLTIMAGGDLGARDHVGRQREGMPRPRPRGNIRVVPPISMPPRSSG